jgi:capsular exopolysaccharide synthesis family protein
MRDRESQSAPSSSSSTINLSWQGPIPEDCNVILEAIIAGYQEFLESTYKDVNEKTYNLIKEARDTLQVDIADKQKKLQKFRTEHEDLTWKAKDGSNFHQARLSDIETRRSTLILHGAELAGRIKALEKAKAAGGREAVLMARAATRNAEKLSGGLGTANSIEEQLLPLRVMEKKMKEQYGEAHPDLKSIRQTIAATEELLRKLPRAEIAPPKPRTEADEVAEYGESLKEELADVTVCSEALEELLNKEKAAAKALSLTDSQEAALESEIKNSTLLLEQIIGRLREIKLVTDPGGYYVNVLSEPRPGKKVAPVAMQIFLLAGILGLMVGVGFAYLADLSDKSFRTPEEIRRRLGLPVIGHIPFMARASEKTMATLPAANGKAIDASLRVHHQSRSREAEAYRSLRTSLYFSTRMGRHTVIQVTSPNMGDGKSTLAANLAVSIAQSGKRVVIVDADFRRPRQHSLFGLSSEIGMASVIAHDAELPDAVKNSGIEGLSVLPCGPRPANPAELLTSPRFDELLAQLREKYDFVIVDTPPLLAVTDPCVVAPRVDGVLLTIRVSRNGRPAAERAKDMLASLGAKVLGVVVNGIGRDASSYGYGYAYGYGYGDGYSYDAKYEYDGRDQENTNGKPLAKAE